MTRCFPLLALTLCAPALVAQVSPPSPQVAYQGRLTKGGVGVTGTHTFAFSILDSQGTVLWTSGNQGVSVNDGLYAVALGGSGMAAIPAEVLASSGLRLRVVVDGETLSPDTDLVPALQASSAFTLLGSLAGDVTGTQNATVVARLNGVPLGIGAPSVGQALVFDGSAWSPSSVVGTMGPEGPQGPKGDTGAIGPKGDTGATGPKGDTGPIGLKGDTGPIGLKGDTGPIGPKGDTGATGADANCAGVAAPIVSSVEVPSGDIYSGITYQVTVNATSSKPLTYSIVATGASFTAGGSPGVFNCVPASAGGPFNCVAIVSNGCQIAMQPFTIATAQSLPQIVYQSKIETNPTVTSWYYLNKPAVVGNDVFFDYSSTSGHGNVYMDIWSIATPSSPTLQATYGGPAEYSNNHLWNHRGISVSPDGSRTVLRSDFSSAWMDTSTKTNPILINYTATIGAPISGAVSGTTVYIGQGSSSELYWVWNTVANTVTKANNQLGQSVFFNSVMPIGGYLYAASTGTAKGLFVFDPSGPSSTPVFSDGSTYATGLALNGTTLLVASETMGAATGYLKIYNVSTPATPSFLGQVALSGIDVAVSGHLAYVINSTSLSIVNIANPASPSVVVTKTLTDLGIPSGEAIGAVTISGSKMVLRTSDSSVRDRLYVYLLQ